MEKTILEHKDIIIRTLKKEIEEFTLVANHFLFEEGLVNKITTNVKQMIVSDIEDYRKSRQDNLTIKIEGLENFSRELNMLARLISPSNHFITFHLFLSGRSSISFNMHKDPCHVLMVLLEGEKKVIFEESEFLLNKENPFLFVPKNTSHKVENIEPSIMMSVGVENYYNERTLV